MIQQEYYDLLSEYRSNLLEAEEKHSGKIQEIKRSRQIDKQVMPDSWQRKLSSANKESGNDPEGTATAKRSKYVHPIINAITGKILQDLSTRDATFDVAANTEEGVPVFTAFEDIMKKTYALQNVSKETNFANFHAVVSGTHITRPTTQLMKEEKIVPSEEGWKEQTDIYGRGVGFIAYDPLTTLVDWRAIPGKVAETAEWIAVTIGRKSWSYIKNKWNVDMNVQLESMSDGGTASFLTIDGIKTELEASAGLFDNNGIMIREYYKTDGYCYVIAGDFYVLEKRPNENCIKGRIPFNWATPILDPDSPYGRPISIAIEPTAQVLSTVFNQIADANALKTKAPMVTFEGTNLVRHLTLNKMQPNQIVEISIPVELQASGNPANISISDMFGIPQFQDITESAKFMYYEALNNIYMLTGLNAMSLGGMQDKQIRVSGAADIVANTSLRNSSSIVKALESGFYNPTTKQFAVMFEVYYDEFPELKEKGVTPENIKNMKNIRIKNGSFLPADKMQDIQIAMLALQEAKQNQTMDLVAATNMWLTSLGIVPKTLERDPLELISQDQALGILGVMQERGFEEGAAMLQQVAQQGEGNGQQG